MVFRLKKSIDDDTTISTSTGGDNARLSQESRSEIHEYKTYPQAWVALFILIILRTATTVFQYTFSVIPSLSAGVFGVNLTAITWLANIQGLVYVIMSFFTGWIYEKMGVKRSLLMAGFLCSVGAGIRIIAIKTSPPSFALTMVGQVLGSTSLPLALNIMSMFAVTWFTEKLRATAGMFVGIIKLWRNSGDVHGAIHHKDSRGRFKNAIIVAASFILTFFMPTQPRHPPSESAQQARPSFREGLVMLSKNRYFWMVFLVHGLNVGMSIAFGTIFTQVIVPYGYTDMQAGQINAIGFFAGTIGCSIAGPVLDITKQHRLLLKLAPPLVCFSFVGFYFLMRSESYGMLLYLIVLNQFATSFLVPVAMETGCETSYPVAEATSSSILWQGSQVFGFLIMAVMDVLRDEQGVPKNNMQHALLLLMIVSGVMMVIAFGFQGQMRRSDAAAATVLQPCFDKTTDEEEKKVQQPAANSMLRLSIHGHVRRPSSKQQQQQQQHEQQPPVHEEDVALAVHGQKAKTSPVAATQTVALLNSHQEHLAEESASSVPLMHPRVQGIKLSDRRVSQ
ncbi:major facilitator superfamily domain-containing protein [Gongronella butleri]|nr:major facilitator superfamily domain-containing protein [Gongronella butleri]